jgi:hypothetical protein
MCVQSEGGGMEGRGEMDIEEERILYIATCARQPVGRGTIPLLFAITRTIVELYHMPNNTRSMHSTSASHRSPSILNHAHAHATAALVAIYNDTNNQKSSKKK